MINENNTRGIERTMEDRDHVSVEGLICKLV